MAKRKRPVRAIIDNIRDLSYEDIAASESLLKLLVNEVPKCIEQAHKDKKIYASLFEINATDEYIEIHRRDWNKALNKCLDYFSDPKIEDYEKCFEIKSLMNTVSMKKGKLTVKTTNDE